MLKLTKLLQLTGFVAAVCLSVPMANAADEPNIRLVIKDIKLVDAPLYISVQSRDDYRSSRSAKSFIIKAPSRETFDESFQIPAGDYAVSVWHDLDKDNSFTMDKKWQPLDGWASSGPELKGDPKFDNVKFKAAQDGQVIEISMHYAAKT